MLVQEPTICPCCGGGCHWSESRLAYWCSKCKRYGFYRKQTSDACPHN